MNMNCTEENKKGCRFAIYEAISGESIYEHFYENDQDIKPYIDNKGEKI